MDCVTCTAQGKTSTVESKPVSASTLPVNLFTDGSANHTHDPNSYTTMHRCSNGHQWKTVETHPCPTCGWVPDAR